MQSNIKIAILPFDNISANNENEYLCDGITEEIISALSKLKGLSVTSKTSSFHYKNTDKTLKNIANELEVDFLLEGSVRIIKENLRVNASLVQTSEDVNLWSKSWTNTLASIFELQDTVSIEIADKLREDFGHLEYSEQLISPQTKSIEAYKYYLKGNYHSQKLHQEAIHKALSFYKKALELDTKHAQSYYGISQCYVYMSASGFGDSALHNTLAMEYAEKAYQLNQQIPDIVLGKLNTAFWIDWDFEKAFQKLNELMAMNPSFSEIYGFSSLLFTFLGNFEKAHEQIDKALKLNPLSHVTAFSKAWIYYLSGNFQEAIQHLNKVIDKDPTLVPAISVKVYALLKLKHYKEALDFVNSKNDDVVDKALRVGLLVMIYHYLKDKNREKEAFHDLKYLALENKIERAQYYYYLYKMVLGNTNKTLDWLEMSINQKKNFILFILHDPLVAILKDNQRFKILLTKALGSQQFSTTPTESTHQNTLVDELLAEEWQQKIISTVEKQKLYLQADITLRKLAEYLQIPPNQLSYILNQFIKKSFTNFINSYRLNHFLALINKGQGNTETFMALAYDSGFNSKTAFYNFFKKQTGKTPKQFLKKVKS